MIGKYLENIGKNYQKVYSSVVVDPSKINILSNKLTRDIITLLSKDKYCAMDLSRELKQHEQKIYYHIRKLEAAGIIKQIGTEKRFGMIAKMYSAVSPVIAIKLYEDSQKIKTEATKNLEVESIFNPILKAGKFDGKIVIGDPEEHGKFNMRSKEGSYFGDFALFLGSFITNHTFPYCKIDTEISDEDLKDNLILLGNITTNIVLEKFEKYLPIKFVEGGQMSLLSSKTGKSYSDSRIGFIIKIKNPLNEKKIIIILGGIRTRGTRASILALTQHIHEIYENYMEEKDKSSGFFKIIKGLDRSGKGLIDDVEFVE